MKTFTFRYLKILFFLILLTSCVTTGGDVYYKVKVLPGETLVSIATRYGTSWYAISRDNSIRDYRQVKVGDILYVKPGAGGFIAIGDTNNTGYLETLTHEQWRQRLDEKNRVDTGKQERKLQTNRPRGGFLFGSPEEDKLLWPVTGAISSNYGPRWGRFHHGIDIRSQSGSVIAAAHDGKVIFSGWRGGYGRLLVIHDEAEDFYTYYAHCNSLTAKVGDLVRRGQKVATVGASGKATGSHLHFEYRLAGGRSLNPIDLLSQPSSLMSSK